MNEKQAREMNDQQVFEQLAREQAIKQLAEERTFKSVAWDLTPILFIAIALLVSNVMWSLTAKNIIETNNDQYQRIIDLEIKADQLERSVRFLSLPTTAPPEND